MTNSLDNTKNQNLSWYNRPLWGNQSFVSWFQSLLNGMMTSKQEIPEVRSSSIKNRSILSRISLP